ncbi:hypothetical protein D3P09_00180 [Paenibacillus pinisoli]|uniref:Nitroreductase domain-containing protein n=1 Tax=Paenibacillus pinisoli TaxID=1276110 RepID=A0A3A6PUN8_9BACL|nr:nitroreductase family protein [Paenibacillus pinisoli]RJX40481.1 hypothetical protein D3P09_00180 [Paenibacillus pinisoli]
MKLSDLAEGLNKPIHFEERPVSKELMLELLNIAVWAPNDGLREPWRFIYVDGQNSGILNRLQEPAPAYLLIVMQAEHDSHKQEEDFAAVSCLIQNFRLLAHERSLGVRWTLNEWTYDRKHAEAFMLQDDERIAAVLEVGHIAVHADVTSEKALQEPQLRFELL